MKKRTLLSALIGLFVAISITFCPSALAQTNLAHGRKVLFSPAPNYWATARGDTDATDLTDGKVGKTQRLWSDPSAVGWTYPGRINLALDLGQNSDVDEIAIRLQNGGTVGTGIMFPGWVEAFVSEDGIQYAKVAEFSRWNPNDFHKFNIPHIKARGNAAVDVLRFQNLKTRGRYVGLKIYGSTITVSDEVSVLGTPATNEARTNAGMPSGFSVSQPEVYFHKPYLELASYASLPVPVGLSTPVVAGSDVTLRIDLPPGVTIPGGKIGGIAAAAVQPKVLADGWNQFVLEVEKAKADKLFGQIYMQAPGWKDGQSGELRFQFSSVDWQSPQLSLPLRAVTVPVAPRLKNIMASLGWWDSGTSDWPDQLESFRILGINTFNVFGMWMPQRETDAAWILRERARAEGFFISNIDSSFSPMLKKHRNDKEIFDQFEDGTVGTHLCISYRGPFSGADFQWALLECYTNGARGVWSWSSRMWDSEGLIAFNKVIRAIAPLEDVIIGGELVGENAVVVGEGRISGIKMGPRMLLLAADYYTKSGGEIQLKLNLPAKSVILDALSGESVQTALTAGQHTLSIPLEGQRARLLEVRPL